MTTFMEELKSSSDARLDRLHEVLLGKYIATSGNGDAKAAELYERSRQVERELERRENNRLVGIARRRRKQASMKLTIVS